MIRPARRRFALDAVDGIAPLALTLTSLISIQPLMRRQMLCSDDGIFHIHKALGLELLLRRGYWLPRWSPEMAHGFGYPLYNFYAPLGSYVLAGLHALGFSYPAALHVGLGLAIWLSGLAVYGLVRRWWGAAPGLVAGVLYMTAPYLAFDVLFRGALAETLAWIWLPVVLWAVSAAVTGERPGRSAVLAVLAYAALMLTHNAMALVCTPLIAGQAAVEAWQVRSWRKLASGLAIIVAGAGLSAFFWIPALGEQSLVQTDRLLVPPIFTYYTNYLTPAELLAPPQAADPLLINPSPTKALGLVAAALALVGSAGLLRSDVRRSVDGLRVAFYTVALLVYGALTLPVSGLAWDNLPLLPFVQFPWRMLMPAALCASVLAGAGIHAWTQSKDASGLRRSWIAATGVILIAVLGHLSWWYPRYCRPFVEETVARMLQYEMDTATLGTSAKAEFLPRTVHSVPDDRSVAEAIQRGEQPQRLSGLPEGVSVEVVSADPLEYRVRVDTPVAFDATYLMFDYEGWGATVDGQAVPITPTSDHGLIGFQIPAGVHEIVVRFGSTPLRNAAGALSALTVIVLFAFVVWGWRNAAPRNSTAQSAISKLHLPVVLPLIASILLLAAKVLWIDRAANPLRQSNYREGRLSEGEALDLAMAGGLQVLSYDVPDVVRSGDNFDVALYAAAVEPPPGNYRPKFTLVDEVGAIWNDAKDALPPRWHREPPPTSEWPVGQYAQWARHDLTLPGTPPGRYRLYAEVFDTQSLLPLSVLDANGNSAAPQFDLAEVVVARPGQPASLESLAIQFPSDTIVAPGLRLLGYNLDRLEAQPGDTMLVTLFWRDEGTDNAELMATLSLEGSLGRAFSTSFSPASEQFPTPQWLPGDVWRGQHLVRLPADLADDDYRWRLAIGNGSEELGATEIGSLRVTGPDRTFTAPDVDVAIEVAFGDFAKLVGLNLELLEPHPGETLDVGLLWQATASSPESYRVFLHLSDAAGRVWAQSDAVPANWTRPTTGWLAGEYILDEHSLALPPEMPRGEYLLAVGMADVVTGARARVGGLDAPDGRASIFVVTVAP